MDNIIEINRMINKGLGTGEVEINYEGNKIFIDISANQYGMCTAKVNISEPKQYDARVENIILREVNNCTKKLKCDNTTVYIKGSIYGGYLYEEE